MTVATHAWAIRLVLGQDGHPIEKEQALEVLHDMQALGEEKANGRRAVEILLVEDNPGDARLMAETLSDSRVPLRLNVVDDGVEAMAFLRRDGAYIDAPRPDLILLDLNLPRKDGREVLAEIRDDGNLSRIPVVVLTTSEAPSDVKRAYELNANCYITKPGGLDEFITVMKSIQYFWSMVVNLPRE